MNGRQSRVVYLLEDGDPTWLEYATFGLTLVAAIAAVATIVYAVKAWRAAQTNLEVAQSNLETAQAGLKIAQVEHSAFMAQVVARARLEPSITLSTPLTFHLLKGRLAEESEFNEVKGEKVPIKWSLRVRNTGDKAASQTTIHFYTPSGAIIDPVWVTQQGEEVPDPDKVAGPDRVFGGLGKVLGKNTPIFTERLNASVDRLAAGRTIEKYVSATLSIPKVGEERTVVAKIAVWADELPDETDEVVATIESKFKRIE